MSAKWVVVVAVLVLVVGAAAGFGGYQYGLQQGQLRAQDIRTQFLAQRGAGANGVQGAGAQGANGAANRQFNPNNFANGQVKSVSGDTIELSTATEVLKVKLSDQTQIQKTGPGSVSDILAGERVTIQGTRGSDGTFTAQAIQIGNRGGFGAPPGTDGANGAAAQGGQRRSGTPGAPAGAPQAQPTP